MCQDATTNLTSKSRTIALLGLIAGPLIAAATYASLPGDYRDASGAVVEFPLAGRATLAAMTWMGIWWLTEAIPIYATALLPLAVFPLLGVANMKATSTPYANPLIFLFMGGFLLALSMQKWGLGKRIALTVLGIVGTRPVNMIAGFMFTTAVLSAFVSNTATAAMMMPIAASVIRLVKMQGERANNFAVCLMLGIAYSASIGGVATIIGSPPNVFLVSYLNDSIAEPYRTELSFSRWLLFGVPLAIVFLPIVFVVLTRVLYPIKVQTIEGGDQLIRGELDLLGPINRGEWATFIVFMVTATLWIIRPVLTGLTFGSSATWLPFAGLTDAGIAMLAALVLFVIPVDAKSRQFVLDWNTALKLPWGILILFGGGLSLAAAVQANGVAEFLGSYARFVSGMPPVVVVVCVATGMIFLTELTSNTATSATLIPVLGAVAPGLGIHPYLLVVPAAIAASCAFMLPVATPPNAIVFATGTVNLQDMVRAGLWLNLIAIALVTLLTMLLINPILVG
ncbi:MAG: sodium-dependent dicarboxylate transporter 2/3/5 [Pirellulaceae bacterium]|jgi:sodium-dependent dicarboxylate transporter 2/3/5